MERFEIPVADSGSRGRKKVLAKFREQMKNCPFQKLFSHVNYATANLPPHAPGRVPKGRGMVVEMHFPVDDKDEHGLELFSTMLNQLNVFEGDRHQLCAYFCSMIATFFPGWTGYVKTSFNENMGFTVKEIHTDEMRETIGVQPMRALPKNEALVYLGQAISLLYKNINQSNNYVEVMGRSIAAMKVICGVSESVQINMIMTLEKAKIVNRMLGSDHKLKKTMLEIILRSIVMEGEMGKLCNYLATILEHTDMESIVFIKKALVVTNSPALRRREIAHEYRNFCMVLSVINATDLPAYFKILLPPYETSIADRNNFPTLVALAERILKAEAPSSDHQLGILGYVSERLLAELERVHYARNESESDEIPKKKKTSEKRRVHYVRNESESEEIPKKKKKSKKRRVHYARNESESEEIPKKKKSKKRRR